MWLRTCGRGDGEMRDQDFIEIKNYITNKHKWELHYKSTKLYVYVKIQMDFNSF